MLAIMRIEQVNCFKLVTCLKSTRRGTVLFLQSLKTRLPQVQCQSSISSKRSISNNDLFFQVQNLKAAFLYLTRIFCIRVCRMIWWTHWSGPSPPSLISAPKRLVQAKPQKWDDMWVLNLHFLNQELGGCTEQKNQDACPGWFPHSHT